MSGLKKFLIGLFGFVLFITITGFLFGEDSQVNNQIQNNSQAKPIVPTVLLNIESEKKEVVEEDTEKIEITEIAPTETETSEPNVVVSEENTIFGSPTSEYQEEDSSEPVEQNCHPSYTGACLNPNASDYDCAGGSGNGPYYIGTVQVIGHDVFDLDRDNDGWGCE